MFLLLPQHIFAATSPFRSANWVATDGDTPYSNLTNCQITDGTFCSHPNAMQQANLYFSSFGTLADFGIPPNSTITKIHIKVTGKNSDTQRIYLDRGKNKKPLTSLCQSPFDLWTTFLGPTTTTKQFDTTFSQFSTGGNNLDQCFTASTIDAQSYTFSIYDVEPYAWSSDIDNLEIAFDFVPPVSPTPTNTLTPTPTQIPPSSPTATPTPTPTAVPTPVPFLDLPWDYESKGQSFTQAALSMSSYFDHSYPLLSSGLLEPPTFAHQVTTFQNENSLIKSYSSHDGYDYANLADVHLGDPVLAAAAGFATYINSCAECGNMIVIDHSNGYQTRYLHLQKAGLITTIPNQKVWANDRQIIGRVGATGNVSPTGDAGAHIHFGVFENKNHDGNFDDNVPDGATDPFGWQSTAADPWSNYSFFFNGQLRTGNTSFYLWKQRLAGLQIDLPANGGVFSVGNATITFPADSSRPDLSLSIQSSPVVQTATLLSLGTALDITAKDALNNFVKLFSDSIVIKIDFSKIDLSRYDLGTATFAIYSSSDGKTWNKEPTVIDLSNKTATTQVNHLTMFALMAKPKDTIPPVTTAFFKGSKSKPNCFSSNTTMTLSAKDNKDGLGVDYTLIKIDSGDWQTYTKPITLQTEGNHTLVFYSVDKGGTIETVKTITIMINHSHSSLRAKRSNLKR